MLGMFTSPDSYVQAPDLSQNLNRYSYCLNNPLKYTDPTGEFWHLVIGAVIGGTVNLIANWKKIDGNFWKGVGYFGVGAAAGALGAGVGAGISSAMAGGSFGAGFIGTSNAMTTGFMSGMVSGATGGFSSGFTLGFGNGIVDNKNFSTVLGNGIKEGVIGLFSGGIIGGIIGGVDAKVHNRNFFTGAERQHIVFSIDEKGNVIISGDIERKLLTKLTTDDTNFHPEDGLYHYEIKIPKAINGIDQTLKSNEQAGINSFSFDKTAIHITSYNPVKFIKLYGWRYLSNPINSLKNLFHSRQFIWPW
jgi:hypothetical protein